jgi:hypothetical protein
MNNEIAVFYTDKPQLISRRRGVLAYVFVMSTMTSMLFLKVFNLSPVYLSKRAYSYKEILHIPSQNTLPNIFGYCALLKLQHWDALKSMPIAMFFGKAALQQTVKPTDDSTVSKSALFPNRPAVWKNSKKKMSFQNFEKRTYLHAWSWFV